MDDQLISAVRARLDGADLDKGTRQLVIAACTGTPLDQAAEAVWPDPVETTTEQNDAVFLAGITVQGFRGIGPRRLLDLPPGPGLTLVVGRNGSGKSSFAEALEMCLTGTSSRWAGRPKSWQETWRNLHDGDTALVAAELVGIDAQPRTLTHTWPDGEAAVTGGTCTLDDGRTLDDLGWQVPLSQYRPLLSFNEVGGMFDGRPSDLYDAIATILGVEPIRDAAAVLTGARLEGARPIKQVTEDHKRLLVGLRDTTDPRAEAVLAAIEGKEATWDLAAAERAVEGEGTDPTSATNRLRGLATLRSPHPDGARKVATGLRTATEQLAAATATDAGRARRLSQLLRTAIDHVDHDGTTACPVCGSDRLLDEAWRQRAAQEADELAAQADAVTAAERAMRTALAETGHLLPPLPDQLHDAHLVDVDAAEVIAAWQALRDVPADDTRLADHLEATIPPLDAAVTAMNAAARVELERRQDDWRPLADAVRVWIPQARQAIEARRRGEAAAVAERWLTGCAADLEAERFAPIREQVRDLWSRLRLQSNVELKDVTLKRAGNQRRLELDVAVDDCDASALGVMSQGELHSLALAVFLPRATADDSPFRFVVLDDPVQAMDPARVDGLAGVLADVARDRQVVVMTHDTRLPDAVRRLQIPATVIEVTRQAQSSVALRTVDDPVRRYLDDARALAKTQSIPERARKQLVPQMCRSAVEAAAMDVYRGRRLRRGEGHESVEAVLADRKVHDLVALALFDGSGASEGAQVFPTLHAWGREVADAFTDCKAGTHTGERRLTDLDLVSGTKTLVRLLRQKAPA